MSASPAGCGDGSETSGSWRWSRRSSRRASSPRMAPRGTRSLAPRKAGSSHRCSATWPCRSSTTITSRRGRPWAPPPRRGSGIDARGWRPGGWSATPTISSCWSPAPARMPRRCGRRSQRCSPRWGCACRRPRPGSAISTRASTSSGSASSGTQSEARASATSTPTPPRRPWRRSRRSYGRCPARTETSRSPSCYTSSTRCCADGPATSSTGSPRRPSATCVPLSGGGWSAGCAASIPTRAGSGCGGATSRGGGRPTGRSRWSTQARSWSAATATGAASLTVDRAATTDHQGVPLRWARGEPDAGQLACPVRRRGPGKRTVGDDSTAPRPDPTHFNVRLGDQGRLCCLVIVGVRADGRKELVAIADGERESTDAWAELLRDLRRWGMRAPVVMVGDGALGLWRALSEVFPAPASSAAGCTRSPTSWARCPRASTPAPAGR
jgi:hypothetical protein